MLNYMHKSAIHITSNIDIYSYLDLFLSSNLERSKKVAAIKEAQKKLQLSTLTLNIPPEVEKAILTCNDAQSIVIGYLEKIFTCQQVITFYCKYASNVDKKYGCMSETSFESALIQAQLLDQYLDQTGKLIGPLHGIPVAFSDEAVIAGLDCSVGCLCGSMAPSIYDSPLVELIKKAGAIVITKTNVPWHLVFSEAANPIYGKTVSPHSENSSLGGRCGALALLTSTSPVLVGFGTDQAGGLRLPAACAGVFTLKPTSLRIPTLTKHSLYDSIPSTSGPISSSLESLIFMYQVLFSQESQAHDPITVPVSFQNSIYYETLTSERLTIGMYVDDEIVRASPSSRRAVLLTAAALHARGHNVIRFSPPCPKKAFILMSKLFSYEKYTLDCISAGFKAQTSTLRTIFPMYTFSKIPRTFKSIVFYLFGIGMKDSLLKELSTIYGGGSRKGHARSLEEYNDLTSQKEDYKRLFANAWQNPTFDFIICPVTGTIPQMPFTSTPFITTGNFYTQLYNLLDYPAGYVPHVTKVVRDDQIPNVIQYSHQDRYLARSDRNFNFLSVMALEEVNNCIHSESVVGVDLGVQVVGLPFQEEKVLAGMKLISSCFNEVIGMKDDIEVRTPIKPSDDFQNTSERLFGEKLQSDWKPQIRLRAQMKINPVHIDDYPEKIYHTVPLVESDYQHLPGALPFQRALKPQQRSSLHFEDLGNQDFIQSQKKKRLTKRIIYSKKNETFQLG